MNMAGKVESSRAWRRVVAANPELRERENIMQAARKRLHRAEALGRIQRPTICESCGVASKIEAAHVNYSEHIAVRWLCRPCHRSWDRRSPKGPLAMRYVKPAQTHCTHGHIYDVANTYIAKEGHRECRTCHREQERARQKRLRESLN